ncbi:MAG TPA: TonB-dependent receptor [Myxococcales bacterium]
MRLAVALALCAFGALAQELEGSVEGERRKDAGEIGMRASEARDLAGSHGDAVVAAQMLPGIAREPAGSGQLVVWGALPAETRLAIDGIDVPALYHGGGLRSVVPTELVRRIDLLPAAFGASWGRALGGVLDVEMAAPETASARAAADPLDAHAAASATFAAGRAFAGVRYSLLDRILGPHLSETAREVFPLPRYLDGQLVASFDLRAHETLEVLLFGSSDTESRSVGQGAFARGDDNLDRWGRLGLRYRRQLDDGADTTIVAWAGDQVTSLGSFADLGFSGQTSWAQSAGLRAAYRMPLGDVSDVSFGVDGIFTRTHLRRNGSLTTPAREGDVRAFGEPPGVDVAFDDWTVGQGDVALFLESNLSFGDFTISPGFRAVAIASDVSALVPLVPTTAPLGSSQLEILPEPRLQVAYRASDRLRVFAAAGLHHQAPAPEDLSATFGAPTLTSSSAVHIAAGAAYRIANHWTSEATGYLRLLDDLPTRSPRPTPLLAQAFVEQGTGKAYGVQAVLRWQGASGWSGFFSALVSRSERQDVPGGPTRLFDFDQPLALTAAGSWRLGRNILGARVRYASGFPRTPVQGSFFDVQQGREEPLFGAQNSERLPAFFALDLSAARTFSLGAGRTLRVYVELENATAHANAEDYVYSSDWSTRGIVEGLPPLALLGAEIVL